MLSERDKNAVAALIVRQVEAATAHTAAQRDLEEVKQRVASAVQDLSKLRVGFEIFGFTLTGDKPWDPIREAIGPERYNAAIAAARGQKDKAVEEEADEDEDDYEPSEGELEKIVPPNIREIVLDRLQHAGEAGTKVSPIKAFIAAKGVEMHDKTVGMTLYRLSKEGAARRDGRTWFFVPPKEEAKSPGAGAPGPSTGAT